MQYYLIVLILVQVHSEEFSIIIKLNVGRSI